MTDTTRAPRALVYLLDRGEEWTLARVLDHFGDCRVHLSRPAPSALAALAIGLCAGDRLPVGAKDLARSWLAADAPALHLELRRPVDGTADTWRADTRHVEMLVVREADVAEQRFVTGHRVTLADWFTAREPDPVPADGEVRVITLQPRVRDDLELPYPVFVLPDGQIARQDFWRGERAQLAGFQNVLDVHEVDVLAEDFLANPSAALGRYPVYIRDDGSMYPGEDPIESARPTIMKRPAEWRPIGDVA